METRRWHGPGPKTSPQPRRVARPGARPGAGPVRGRIAATPALRPGSRGRAGRPCGAGNAAAVDPDAGRRTGLFAQYGARRLRAVDGRRLSRVPRRLRNLCEPRPAGNVAGAPGRTVGREKGRTVRHGCCRARGPGLCRAYAVWRRGRRSTALRAGRAGFEPVSLRHLGPAVGPHMAASGPRPPDAGAAGRSPAVEGGHCRLSARPTQCRLYARTGLHHRRRPAGPRPCSSGAAEARRCGVDRRARLSGLARPLALHGCPPGAGSPRRRGSFRGGRPGAGRRRTSGRGRAVAPVSPGHHHEPGPPARAAGLGAPAGCLAGRGRLRQRVPLRRPAARGASGAGRGPQRIQRRPCLLHRNLLEGAVPRHPPWLSGRAAGLGGRLRPSAGGDRRLSLGDRATGAGRLHGGGSFRRPCTAHAHGLRPPPRGPVGGRRPGWNRDLSTR